MGYILILFIKNINMKKHHEVFVVLLKFLRPED